VIGIFPRIGPLFDGRFHPPEAIFAAARALTAWPDGPILRYRWLDFLAFPDGFGRHGQLANAASFVEHIIRNINTAPIANIPQDEGGDANMKQHRKFKQLSRVPGVLLTGVFLVAGVEEQALAKGSRTDLYVTNNGIDSISCGEPNDPCRSITQAIANATAGDKILIGPGQYGDLNSNGVFGETGEEVAEIGFGCYCMINVNKEVTIISEKGAFSTVLDAKGVVNTVQISSSGVVFGSPNYGFFITGARNGGNGIVSASGTSGVTIAGNVASGNGGSTGGGGIILAGTDSVAKNNLAFGNSNGFGLFGSGHLVTGNVSSSNTASGFVMTGTDHLIFGNESIGNGGDGFTVQGIGGDILKRNSAFGNKFFGISVQSEGASPTIIQNNIYSNNNMPTDGTFPTNCGILNWSGTTIIATDNFWGASSGPGLDPADNGGAGSGCDNAVSETVVDPFATEEFKSVVRRIR